MKVYGALFAGGMGVLCAVWMMITLSRSEYLTAVVVFGFAVFCFGLLGIVTWRNEGSITPRGTFDASGTTIRPNRGIDLFTQLWLVVTVAAMALYAVLAPLGKLDIPAGREQRYSLPVVGAAIAVVGVPMLWGAFRRGSMKYLRLRPNGFDFEQGLSSAHRAWDEVKDVTDQAPGRRPVSSAIVMVMSDGHTPTMTAATFTPDGKALRDMVRFYWQHPERRVELTDGRAVERLQNEQFDVD
jgi:hypothetical protein